MNRDRRNLILFAVITLTLWMSVYFYLPTLSAYVKFLGGSSIMIGLVGGAYGLTQALLRIPTGIWSDQVGRKKPFIVAGFVVGLISNLLFILAKEPSLLFWARSLAGISVTSWVVLTIYVSSYFPEDRLVQTMGVLFAASNLGQLLASASGAYLTEYWGWKMAFFVALGTGLIGLLALCFLEPETPVATKNFSGSDFIKVSLGRTMLAAILVGIVIQYGQWAMLSFSPLQALKLGASKGDLGWLTFCNMAPTILAAMALGRSYQRFGKHRVMILAFLLLAIGLLLIPFSNNLIQLTICLIIGGMGRGILFPASMSMAVAGIAAQQKATAMGIYQALYAVGMFLGPAFSGMISENYGLTGAFTLAAVIVFSGGVAWWLCEGRLLQKQT